MFPYWEVASYKSKSLPISFLSIDSGSVWMFQEGGEGSKVELINERYEILKIVDMKLFKMYNIWHRLYKWNAM